MLELDQSVTENMPVLIVNQTTVTTSCKEAFQHTEHEIVVKLTCIGELTTIIPVSFGHESDIVTRELLYSAHLDPLLDGLIAADGRRTDGLNHCHPKHNKRVCLDVSLGADDGAEIWIQRVQKELCGCLIILLVPIVKSGA